MNNRERFLGMLSFQPVDRGFNYELGMWGQVIDRWHEEGWPIDEHVPNLIEGSEFFQIDRIGYLPLRVVELMPDFEPEVLAEDERYITMRYSDGHVSRALKEGTSHGTRMSMDQNLSWPITSLEDWQGLKRRYNAHSPARYPQWWGDVVRCLQGRDYPLALTHNGCFGLFSMMRRLMGTETACMAFYDQTVLVEDMLDYLTDYLIELTTPALQALEVDYFNYFEDFSYNAGPLVGPKLFRQYLMPRYRRINDHLRAHGVRHIWLDSDGNSDVLIPLFIEVGITCHWPLERVAGMDPLALRKKYGHDIALAGGIDKRALAMDRRAIDEELYHHVPQLLEDGGYIPTLDHAVPPDISYDNWLYYLEVKRKLLGF